MPEHTPQPTGRVKGKIALVTGAASGIGEATALTFAAHGAAVFCADLNLEGANKTAQTIQAAGGSAWPCRLDVTSERAWEEVMEQVLGDGQRLNIVVNSAGIAHAAPVTELCLDDWRRVMAVNVEGVVLGSKHAIRVMRQGGWPGSIINVSSISGMKAQPGASAYCTSKAAIIMFSKVAAVECVKNGDQIRINTISPSGVKTPMWKTMPFFQEIMAREGGEEAAFAAMLRESPRGRWALPEEIAMGILYLASDESLFVTGSNLVIDNGDTAGA
jgi:NAD(P)-dependent dehydrogenase (short-subunit alcohol dehydrogenase family)